MHYSVPNVALEISLFCGYIKACKLCEWFVERKLVGYFEDTPMPFGLFHWPDPEAQYLSELATSEQHRIALHEPYVNDFITSR